MAEERAPQPQHGRSAAAGGSMDAGAGTAVDAAVAPGAPERKSALVREASTVAVGGQDVTAAEEGRPQPQHGRSAAAGGSMDVEAGTAVGAARRVEVSTPVRVAGTRAGADLADVELKFGAAVAPGAPARVGASREQMKRWKRAAQKHAHTLDFGNERVVHSDPEFSLAQCAEEFEEEGRQRDVHSDNNDVWQQHLRHLREQQASLARVIEERENPGMCNARTALGVVVAVMCAAGPVAGVVASLSR